MKQKLESQSHQEIRGTLRVVGPMIVGVGILFTLVGLGSFFSSFGTFEAPRYFWCAFIGLPMVGVGMSICQFAFLGTVQRYMASETAPVARDTINYMVDGTQESVKTIARSVGQGIQEAMHSTVSTHSMPTVASASTYCPQCQKLNASDANFCNGCGAAMPHQQLCGYCNEENDADAKFCDHCGKSL